MGVSGNQHTTNSPPPPHLHPPQPQELSNFCLRCRRIARNIVCQIAGCKNDDAFGAVHVLPLAEALCTVLRILITVDTAISGNVDLVDAWTFYKNMVRSKSMSAVNPPNPEFERFERMLVELDTNLLSSRSFLHCIEQNFNAGGDLPPARQNTALHSELKAVLSILYDKWCSIINSPSETTERHNIIGVYGLYALYRHIVPSKTAPDPKLYKRLWTVFPHKCPMINIIGDLTFTPCEFLVKYAQFDVKGIDPNSVQTTTLNYAKKLDEAFPAQAARFQKEALAWIALSDGELSASARNFSKNSSTPQNIEMRGSLILKGVVIAFRASTMIRTLLSVHKSLGIPLQSKLIAPLRNLVEVLKAIEQLLGSRRRAAVASVQPIALKVCEGV